MSGAVANATTKVGRNDLCPCGSGRKFKHCCEGKTMRAEPPAQPSPRVPPSPALKQRLRTLFLAAEGHANAGRSPEAMALFKEIVQLDPHSSQAHHALGMLWLRCGRPAEAVASLQRALELRPGSDPALRGLVDRLQAEAPTPDALRACRKLSRTADSALKRRYYLAKALVLEGKPDEAEKELERLLAGATPSCRPGRSQRRGNCLRSFSQARGHVRRGARCPTGRPRGRPTDRLPAAGAVKRIDRGRSDVDRSRASARRSARTRRGVPHPHQLRPRQGL